MSVYDRFKGVGGEHFINAMKSVGIVGISVFGMNQLPTLFPSESNKIEILGTLSIGLNSAYILLQLSRMQNKLRFLPEGKYTFEAEGTRREINVNYGTAPRVVADSKKWKMRVGNSSYVKDRELLKNTERLRNYILSPEVVISGYGKLAIAEEAKWRNSLSKKDKSINWAVNNSRLRTNVLNGLSGSLQQFEYHADLIDQDRVDALVAMGEELINELNGKTRHDRKQYHEWSLEEKREEATRARTFAEGALIHLGLLSVEETVDKVNVPIKRRLI